MFLLSAAQLVGNFCEAVFFGLYLVTCIFCARTLFLRGSGTDERWIHAHEVRRVMTATALSLFAICTFDVATGLLHNYHAFIESADPEQEFKKPGAWINTARLVNNVLIMIIWDFILIYRCWIVHGYRWRVMTPSITLYLGSIAVACWLVASLIVETQLNLIDQWITYLAIATIQNIFTTSLLIWRIWRVDKESQGNIIRSEIHQPRYLRKVIRTVIESGATYTTMVFLSFLCAATGSNALYPVSDMTIQAAGIAFNAILNGGWPGVGPGLLQKRGACRMVVELEVIQRVIRWASKQVLSPQRKQNNETIDIIDLRAKGRAGGTRAYIDPEA